MWKRQKRARRRRDAVVVEEGKIETARRDEGGRDDGEQATSTSIRRQTATLSASPPHALPSAWQPHNAAAENRCFLLCAIFVTYLVRCYAAKKRCCVGSDSHHPAATGRHRLRHDRQAGYRQRLLFYPSWKCVTLDTAKEERKRREGSGKSSV